MDPRGVCGLPASGAAAFVQNGDQRKLCSRNPPYGFRPLCAGAAGPALAMLRGLRDPARCYYPTCAVVGASGNMLGARQGAEIDAHDAVIRINAAPDGNMALLNKHAPHRHRATWVADVGARTSWRVITMEGYGYLGHYPRFWLAPPLGHGTHANMSGIPQDPLLAVVCHSPGTTMGRCRAARLDQTFNHPEAASYLLNPELISEMEAEHFSGVKGQRTPSTGMAAIALARKMCGVVHLYGFGNGTCGRQCYHYYECPADGGADGDKGRGFVDQQKFLDDEGATGGYHNFSAQALALVRMAERRQIVAHWGTCAPNGGGAPPEFRNPPGGKGAGGRGGGRGDGRGRGGRSGRGRGWAKWRGREG